MCPRLRSRRDAATPRQPSTATRAVEQGVCPRAWGGGGGRTRTPRVERRGGGEVHRRFSAVQRLRPPHLGRPRQQHNHRRRAVAHDLSDHKRLLGEGSADEASLAPPPILIPAVDRLGARMRGRGVETGEVRRARHRKTVDRARAPRRVQRLEDGAFETPIRRVPIPRELVGPRILRAGSHEASRRQQRRDERETVRSNATIRGTLRDTMAFTTATTTVLSQRTRINPPLAMAPGKDSMAIRTATSSLRLISSAARSGPNKPRAGRRRSRTTPQPDKQASVVSSTRTTSCHRKWSICPGAPREAHRAKSWRASSGRRASQQGCVDPMHW